MTVDIWMLGTGATSLMDLGSLHGQATAVMMVEELETQELESGLRHGLRPLLQNTFPIRHHHTPLPPIVPNHTNTPLLHNQSATALLPYSLKPQQEKMEKKGLVMKLPPGFRFHPTDEELVVQYLKRKVLSYPLPASIMPDIHLSSYDPWDLPAGGAAGCGEKERYFFHFRKGTNNSKVSRAAGSGYWKATGKERPVTVNGGKQVVGMKKVMVFHRGRPSNGSRTDWVLHEYRLPQNNSTTTTTTHMDGWVLCRVFEKERSTKLNISKMSEPCNNQEDTRNLVDFMRQRDQHVASPNQEMESSCVTQNSDDDEEEEENSSCSSDPDRKKH